MWKNIFFGKVGFFVIWFKYISMVFFFIRKLFSFVCYGKCCYFYFVEFRNDLWLIFKLYWGKLVLIWLYECFRYLRKVMIYYYEIKNNFF